MFIRFENDFSIEVTSDKYNEEEYTWFETPEGYQNGDLCILNNGLVSLASDDEQESYQLSQRKDYYIGLIAGVIDEKKMEHKSHLPGKEREYAAKRELVNSSQGGNIEEDSIEYLFLIHEANAKGITVNELYLDIKQKVTSLYQYYGLLAGFSVTSKERILSAGSTDELEFIFSQVLDDFNLLP
ncbi:hypothetical protein HWQ46_09810 [Shewanella sp. D64]|uniref:hypothetical protein n=1 Tax=unclassified Shewanella TaxID=196818 RepID=UPI0022BA5DF1|nr:MULTISPECIES: hypothetical protein [unclassified Shewanella]MEC4725838.1 hypothetical protein [Shewanella sp. D64]MEC4737555.1 hypothetical protein [Shewanella sp. E94]WBJ93373.1 hypothetical protein HWQ47_15675 [Shewanella sp. MTB7]